jgi:hypothetical protein
MDPTRVPLPVDSWDEMETWMQTQI